LIQNVENLQSIASLLATGHFSCAFPLLVFLVLSKDQLKVENVAQPQGIQNCSTLCSVKSNLALTVSWYLAMIKTEMAAE